MIKALALDNFWPSFSRRKTSAIHLIKKTESRYSIFRFWFSAALIAANAFLLMSYIYGVNQFANTGYQIAVLQKQLSSLNDSNKSITLQVSEASSMVQIQNNFTAAGFVPAGTPKFLQASQVAER
jgi:cell division protein FtsB